MPKKKKTSHNNNVRPKRRIKIKKRYPWEESSDESQKSEYESDWETDGMEEFIRCSGKLPKFKHKTDTAQSSTEKADTAQDEFFNKNTKFSEDALDNQSCNNSCEFENNSGIKAATEERQPSTIEKRKRGRPKVLKKIMGSLGRNKCPKRKKKKYYSWEESSSSSNHESIDESQEFEYDSSWEANDDPECHQRGDKVQGFEHKTSVEANSVQDKLFNENTKFCKDTLSNQSFSTSRRFENKSSIKEPTKEVSSSFSYHIHWGFQNQ